jgi:hypothetical protein
METTPVERTGDVLEEGTMSRTDTDEFGLSSQIASIREQAHNRVVVPPPSYPGLHPRPLTARLYKRLARLVSFDA